MAGRENKPSSKRLRLPPATTPEARENQLIAMAFDLAEQQIADGTASAQVLTHYLKLGTARERLEREKIARENKLLQARVDQIASQDGQQKMYNDALAAFRGYSGQEPLPESEYDEYED